MGVPAPPDSRRCTVTSKKTGKRCTGWGLTGFEPQLCSVHSPKSKNPVVRDPAGSQALAVQKIRQRKAQQEQDAYVRTLNAKEQLRHRLSAKASFVADTLEAMLEDPDADTRLKAIRFWYEQVHGKAVTPTVTVAGTLSQSQVAEIQASVSGLTSEERLALAREKLGLSGPRQIQDGEVVADAG